jgi:putative inorganic carbon (hco3(-)) transporter
MTRLRGFIESSWSQLPRDTAARWASLFFSLHVLTLLISVAASQAFLAAAGVAYIARLLRAGRERPAPARGQDACATAGERPAPRAINFPPVKLPLLLFCLATINSVLWAEHPEAGGFALRKLVLFLILLLSVNLVVSRRHLSGLLRGIFSVAAVAGLAGIAQFIIQYDRVLRYHHNRVYFYMTLTRTHGFMGHWMNFGGQQMLVFSVLLAFVLLSGAVIGSPPQREEGSGGGGYQDRHSIHHPLTPAFGRRGITRWLYWPVLAVVAISLLLNFTRGVWLGCLVAALYVLARWKPRTLWAVPVLLLVVVLGGPSLVRRRVSLVFHPKEDPALAIRLEMWHTGLRMVREHPWAGVGPDNIPLVYMKYVPPGATPILGYHDHLHDNALQMAAERGLPCLIAWLWFMLALGWHILSIRRSLSSTRWVADAAFAAWLAFVAEGFFEFNFGTTPVLMVFLFLMSTPFIAERLEKAAAADRPENDERRI